MLESNELLQNLESIYAAAHETEDGERCMVCQHPDLRERIKQTLSNLRGQADTELAFGAFLKIAEPKQFGLNDGVIIPPDEFPLGTSPSVIKAAAADRAPLQGTVRVIVVLVDFADKPMAATVNHFKDLFFSLGKPQKSVREYYRDVTGGKVDIQGEVVGPYRLPQTMAQYAHGASGMGASAPNARTMAKDAVQKSNPAVNFSQYDNDGNGFVDAFIVIHAGPAAEVTGSSGHIWSHKWVVESGPLAVDGTKIYAYLTVPEDAKIGVCAHELGHLLFGFPDLYDTDYSSEGIGNWCLMAGGSWGGGGDNPCHPSAWCKSKQNWVTVENRTTNGVVSIADVKTSKKVYRLWKDGVGGNEYFLVENRQRTGFDSSLPAGGLLIWHVDDAVSDNSNEQHYKVALVQADNKRDLEKNNNRGDIGDVYPGSTSNKTFNSNSSPNSRSYSGAVTNVGVTNIGPAGAVMSANLQVRPGASPGTTAGEGESGHDAGMQGLTDVLHQLVDRLDTLLARATPPETTQQDQYPQT